MKKRCILLFCLLIAASTVYGEQVKGFIVEGSIGYFYPSNENMREIYSSRLYFEAGAEFRIGNALALWGSAGLYSGDGKLTFTGESTEIRVIPLMAGVKYYLPVLNKSGFYVAAGGGFFSFREKSVLGTVNSFSPGFTVKTGLMIPVSERAGIDISGRYEYCSSKPDDIRVRIGGLKTTAGFFIRL